MTPTPNEGGAIFPPEFLPCPASRSCTQRSNDITFGEGNVSRGPPLGTRANDLLLESFASDADSAWAPRYEGFTAEEGPNLGRRLGCDCGRLCPKESHHRKDVAVVVLEAGAALSFCVFGQQPSPLLTPSLRDGRR